MSAQSAKRHNIYAKNMAAATAKNLDPDPHDFGMGPNVIFIDTTDSEPEFSSGTDYGTPGPPHKRPRVYYVSSGDETDTPASPAPSPRPSVQIYHKLQSPSPSPSPPPRSQKARDAAAARRSRAAPDFDSSSDSDDNKPIAQICGKPAANKRKRRVRRLYITPGNIPAYLRSKDSLNAYISCLVNLAVGTKEYESVVTYVNTQMRARCLTKFNIVGVKKPSKGKVDSMLATYFSHVKARKDGIKDSGRGKEHNKLFFHGTSIKTAIAILTAEGTGFDPLFYKRGLYGCGTYCGPFDEAHKYAQENSTNGVYCVLIIVKNVHTMRVGSIAMTTFPEDVDMLHDEHKPPTIYNFNPNRNLHYVPYMVTYVKDQ